MSKPKEKEMSAIRKLMSATIGTMLVVGSIGATCASERSEGRRNNANFEKRDTNADSQITFAEFQTPFLERFDQVDSNKDGIISQNDADAFADGRRQKRMMKSIVMRSDLNQNNEVTKAEFENRQKKRFVLLDMNDDGVLTKNEIPKRFESRKNRQIQN